MDIDNTSQLVPSLDQSNCRICFDGGLDPLIHVCKCMGSTKFVHEICLKEWITTKYSDINGAQCELCLYKYSLVVEKAHKCSPKRAFPQHVSNLCVILTCFFIILTMAIIIGLFLKEKADFKSNKIYSIAVLSFCSSVIGVCAVLLIKSMYKVMVIVTVTKWSILPMDDPKCT